MQHWTIDPSGSSVVVEARSSMGPIAWEIEGPTGDFRMALDGHRVLLDPQPQGALDIDLTKFSSGNALYDAELAKRLEVRLHPTAAVKLTTATATSGTGFEVGGQMTLHGVTRDLRGVLTVEVEDDGVAVTGIQQVDIREFGIPAPQMLMLKIFPDVRVHLFLRGTRVDDD